MEKLNELWLGVDAMYVKQLVEKCKFKLKVGLLRTIHYYKAYGMILGQETNGYARCVACGPKVDAQKSNVLHKEVFMGHQRYLLEGHPCQLQGHAHHFHN